MNSLFSTDLKISILVTPSKIQHQSDYNCGMIQIGAVQMQRFFTFNKQTKNINTHIFIFKLFCQGLDLEPLSLLIVEGGGRIWGWSHTWRFIL